MIYDDQREMRVALFRAMDAHFQKATKEGTLVSGVKVTLDGLDAAFSAIDREILIKQVQNRLRFLSDSRGLLGPELIEEVLIAAGVIPERGRIHHG